MGMEIEFVTFLLRDWQSVTRNSGDGIAVGGVSDSVNIKCYFPERGVIPLCTFNLYSSYLVWTIGKQQFRQVSRSEAMKGVLSHPIQP